MLRNYSFGCNLYQFLKPLLTFTLVHIWPLNGTKFQMEVEHSMNLNDSVGLEWKIENVHCTVYLTQSHLHLILFARLYINRI